MGTRCEDQVIAQARELVDNYEHGASGPVKLECPLCSGTETIDACVEQQNIMVKCQCLGFLGTEDPCPQCAGERRYLAEVVRDRVDVQCPCDAGGTITVEVAPSEIEGDPVGVNELRLAFVQLDIERSRDDADARALAENKDKIVAELLRGGAEVLVGLPAKRFAEEAPKRRVRRVAR